MAWDADIPPTSKLLLLALISYYNEKSPRPFPSEKALAKKTKMGLSTVKRQIKYLHSHGHVKIEQKHMGAGAWAVNVYTFSDALLRGALEQREKRKPSGVTMTPVQTNLVSQRLQSGVTMNESGVKVRHELSNNNKRELEQVRDPRENEAGAPF